MKANLLFLLDILIYFFFPLFFWNVGRDYLGDYTTILLSTVPGIWYTLYRFKYSEYLNFTGIFIILNLVSGTLVDILSNSAEQLLWNNVFSALTLATIYLVSYLIKHPTHLYFTLDILVLAGHDRAITKELLLEKRSFTVLNFITLFYCLSECVYTFIMIKCLNMYGIEAFQLEVWLDNILKLFMAGASFLSFIAINSRINEIVSINQKMGRRNYLSYTMDWNPSHLEKSYFYFCNHKH